MVGALDQHHLGAKPGGSDRGRGARRAAADHQHIGFGKDRRLPRRFGDRLSGALPPRPATAAELLKALRSANAARIIAAARRLAENLALPRLAS